MPTHFLPISSTVQHIGLLPSHQPAFRIRIFWVLICQPRCQYCPWVPLWQVTQGCLCLSSRTACRLELVCVVRLQMTTRSPSLDLVDIVPTRLVRVLGIILTWHNTNIRSQSYLIVLSSLSLCFRSVPRFRMLSILR